jgi:hypothetical protein
MGDGRGLKDNRRWRMSYKDNDEVKQYVVAEHHNTIVKWILSDPLLTTNSGRPADRQGDHDLVNSYQKYWLEISDDWYQFKGWITPCKQTRNAIMKKVHARIDALHDAKIEC